MSRPATWSHLPAEIDAHVHEGERLGAGRRLDLHVVHAGHKISREELVVSRLHLHHGGLIACRWCHCSAV